MVRKALADYIYRKFFIDLFQKELGGDAFSHNVVNALNKASPIFTIDAIRDESGKEVMSAEKATAVCRDLGIDLFHRDTQELLAYIEVHPEVDKILASKPILIATQRDLKLLLAVALHFGDIDLLHQAVEDPTNGGVMRSEDTFKYLRKCYKLFN